MDEFIARLNIEHYRKALTSERDPERRHLISRLLAEEESKLAAFDGSVPAADIGNVAVSRLNLRYYQKRLETETDPIIRQILVRMIAEEEENLAPGEERKISGDD